jgi:hypothetical protein
MIIFQQLIVLCDWHGIVDMTPEAISRRTNIPLEIIQYGIKALQEPDVGSRSPLMQGKRITLLEPEHRNWGWLIVNHEYYRNLQSAEDRREYMRGYMEKKRNGGVKRAPKRIEYSPQFEQWWALYPSRKGVKAGKEAALDEFKRTIQSEEDFQQLLKATERYKTVELPKDGERFLKKNYWRDWIPPTIKDIKPGQPTRIKDSDGLVWEMGENGWKQVG